MAHGSNEVSVASTSAAMIFLLDPNRNIITDTDAIKGILVGLGSLVLGFITLGKRYLHKHRRKFMKTTLSNGFIANTASSICLLFASFLGFPVSCTQTLIPSILLLEKLKEGKKFRRDKVLKAILFTIANIIVSAVISIMASFLFLTLNHGTSPWSN